MNRREFLQLMALTAAAATIPNELVCAANKLLGSSPKINVTP